MMPFGRSPFAGQQRSSGGGWGGGQQQPAWSSWFDRRQQAAPQVNPQANIPQANTPAGLPARPPGLMTPPPAPQTNAPAVVPPVASAVAPTRISPALPQGDRFLMEHPEFGNVDPNSPEGKVMMQSRLLMGYGAPAAPAQQNPQGMTQQQLAQLNATSGTYRGDEGFKRWAEENWGVGNPRIQQHLDREAARRASQFGG